MLSIAKICSVAAVSTIVGGIAGLPGASVAFAGGGPGQPVPVVLSEVPSYLGIRDSSLFDAGCERPNIEFYFENFEDGELNTPFVSIAGQAWTVAAPGAWTDSVDTNGHSLLAENATLTVQFGLQSGGYPKKVGFTITDTNGVADAGFIIFITLADNTPTFFNVVAGDATDVATAADDHFVGLTSTIGIKSVQISAPTGEFELDHLQYSRETTASIALPTRGDADGSGTGDIFFHVPGGNVTAWYLNDLVEDPEVIHNTLSSAWTLAGVGDLDGDCDDDLVWRNNQSPAKVQVWMMENGIAVQKTNITSTLGQSWAITAVNDFNGDGRADLFMEQDSGKKMRIWFMNGTQIQSSSFVTLAGFDPSLHTVVTSGDINGDGKADIVWRQTSNGNLKYFRMNGATVQANGTIQAGLSTGWTGLGGGDIDGDGDIDLAFRNANGTVALLMTLNPNFTKGSTVQIAIPSGLSFVGMPDVSGDGKADVVWRKASTGQIIRWRMNGLVVSNSSIIGTGPTGTTVKCYGEK
jgi:hypothetical protein